MDTLIQNFHFLRPLMFLALLPLFWLLYQYKQHGGGIASWQKIMEPALLQYLKVGESSKSSRLTFWLLSLAAILMVVALAGPVWKQLPQPMYSEASALVVVLDLSHSMDAADLKPSRLIRAKQKLTDLLHQHREGEVALVVFAGSAFVVTPLTSDNETILSQLQGLTTDIMPQQGGDIDSGLNKAKALFEQAGVKHGQVLVLTDSARYSKAEVEKLTDAGYQISVIGVGTLDGAPISKKAGGFLTDSHHNIVVAKLEEGALRELALLGQGLYRRMSLDNSDIDAVFKQNLQDIWNQKEQQTKAVSDQWQEEGVWLLLVVIPLLLLSFRQGVFVIMLVFFLQPAPADASDWHDLWQQKDKHGEALMQQQDYKQAYQTFENPAWKAAAAYKDKDYEAALDAWNAIAEPNSEDLYNKANILAQLGRLDEAISAYDMVLEQQPSHKDALANKKLVEALKQQQKEGKDKKEKQDKEKQQKGKDKQEESKQNKSDQNKSDQNKSNSDRSGENKQQQAEQNKKGDSSDKPSQQQQKSEQDAADQAARQEKAKQEKAKQDEKDKQQTLQHQQNQDEGKKDTPQNIPLDTQDNLEKTEQKQAFEQALRRIPDDPAGLLRRKFLYQYKRQQGQRQSRGEQW